MTARGLTSMRPAKVEPNQNGYDVRICRWRDYAANSEFFLSPEVGFSLSGLSYFVVVVGVGFTSERYLVAVSGSKCF